MGIFFLIFIVLLFKSSTNDIRGGDLFKMTLAISIILAILSTFLFSPLSVFAIIGIIIYINKFLKNKNNENKRTKEYGWQRSNYESRQSYNNTYNQFREKRDSTGRPYIPRTLSQRRLIIEKFNKKYQLYLTEDQIQCILNASYVSPIWYTEIADMNYEYENIYEWFNGYTSWLRVYMYVFHVQEITSDIRQQEDICLYAFEAVFKYVDSLSALSIDEKIDRVNNKFFTSFDNVSFMLAYRFLETKGMKHNINNLDVIRNDSEVDELLNKYKSTPGSY